MPEGSTALRLFVAARLNPELLHRIKAEQERLAGVLVVPDVRWTGQDQLHLTLRFFGNVPSTELDSLKQALDRSVKGIRAFQLALEGLGCFPSPQRPSVIWLGLEGELDVLRRLEAQIEQECRQFGSHSEDRPFHPHLTIGRVKTRGPQARRIGECVLGTAVGRVGEWKVEQITLMRSQLNPRGSIYTVLSEPALLG